MSACEADNTKCPRTREWFSCRSGSSADARTLARYSIDSLEDIFANNAFVSIPRLFFDVFRPRYGEGAGKDDFGVATSRWSPPWHEARTFDRRKSLAIANLLDNCNFYFIFHYLKFIIDVLENWCINDASISRAPPEPPPILFRLRYNCKVFNRLRKNFLWFSQVFQNHYFLLNDFLVLLFFKIHNVHISLYCKLIKWIESKIFRLFLSKNK